MVVKQIVLDRTNKDTNILENFRAVKIGICAPAGTKFYLNGGSAIEVNPYGIYELDVSEYGYLISLHFDKLDSTKIIIDLFGEEVALS